METLPPCGTWRESRSADFARHLRSANRCNWCAAFLRRCRQYRICATSTKAAAKAAAERMIGRRETYMSGAA
jgi:hypothetical protein